MGDSGESLTFDLGTPVLNKPIKRDNTKQKKMDVHSINPHWKEQTDHWSPESIFNHLLSY